MLMVMTASIYYNSSVAESVYVQEATNWVKVEWYLDSSGGLHYVTVVPITPQPTVSPTQTPTKTPVEPTVTPEIILPTPVPTETPVPWPTSTPNTDICTGTPFIGWFIRNGPGSTFGKIGYFSDKDDPTSTPPSITVQTFRMQAFNNGWYAFWLDVDMIGWTAEGAWTVTGNCSNLPSDVTYRKGPAALLLHYVPGGNVMEMVVAGQTALNNGRSWGAVVIDDPSVCIQVEAANGTCIARSNAVGDCPDLSLTPHQAAEEYLQRNLWYMQVSGASMYAVFNECVLKDALWWRELITETVVQAKALNYPPLVVGNFLAHEPSEEWLQTTAPAWSDVNKANGMGGYHVYSYFDDTWLCSPNIWMPTDRDILLNSTLNNAGVQGLMWVATELSAGKGDRPVTDYSLTDLGCWFHQIDQRKYVWGAAAWTSGHVGTMPNDATLDGHMIQLAQIVN
jgi:hypothetical protein